MVVEDRWAQPYSRFFSRGRNTRLREYRFRWAVVTEMKHSGTDRWAHTEKKGDEPWQNWWIWATKIKQTDQEEMGSWTLFCKILSAPQCLWLELLMFQVWGLAETVGLDQSSDVTDLQCVSDKRTHWFCASLVWVWIGTVVWDGMRLQGRCTHTWQ